MATELNKNILEMMGEGYTVVTGSATLTNSVTLSITTGAKNLITFLVSAKSIATNTAADNLIGTFATQTVTVSGVAKAQAVGATGTTLIRWLAIAEAGR